MSLLTVVLLLRPLLRPLVYVALCLVTGTAILVAVQLLWNVLAAELPGWILALLPVALVCAWSFLRDSWYRRRFPPVPQAHRRAGG